ncbi:MAG: hypothetical protein ACK59G_01175, partial [Cyanobacteriota bacterium]
MRGRSRGEPWGREAARGFHHTNLPGLSPAPPLRLWVAAELSRCLALASLPSSQDMSPLLMAVTYPRKILNTVGPKQVMAEVVKERKLQILFLNSYRFNEQRSC